MHVGASGASTGLDAGRHQRDDLVELGAGERGERRGPTDQREQIVGAPLPGRGLGDDLLGNDVERELRRDDRVEPTGAYRDQQRGALDQRVAREGIEPTLGGTEAGVVRPTDPLEERGDAAGRADLAHQLDRADIDPELERAGGDETSQLTETQPPFDLVAALLGEAAVMRGHDLLADALTELVRESLGEPTGVHEHECGAVVGHELGDPVQHIAHLIGRGDGLELTTGQLELEIEIALVSDVDDGGRRSVTDKQARHRLDRLLRSGEPNPSGPGVAQRLEALEREREVRTPLVSRDGVDLIEDHGLSGGEHASTAFARDEQEQ